MPASKTVFSWEAADFIQVLKNASQTAGLTVVGELAFAFQPQGVSAVVLLAESHIALHFWPEEAKVTIDIHICDYQKDNLEKAKILTEILTKQISQFDVDWQYLFIIG
ncbi:S-adenosylmethionine decarboxylase [Cylindrospermum stagnale]|uniref:S-adenosylmethionine decarboxylase n=1 Tax=Cylindrospermum stagnale TaxID=142864 RepID=UPI00031147DE|nr:S-adenosylmethionine decarboxylase [Cylindrospermum stagnale]